jgi:hypothetical protein
MMRRRKRTNLLYEEGGMPDYSTGAALIAAP